MNCSAFSSLEGNLGTPSQTGPRDTQHHTGWQAAPFSIPAPVGGGIMARSSWPHCPHLCPFSPKKEMEGPAWTHRRQLAALRSAAQLEMYLTMNSLCIK